MSGISKLPIETKDYDDPLDPIRENETAVEKVGEERDDKIGAFARYLLAASREEPCDPDDARRLGLPVIGGDDD